VHLESWFSPPGAKHRALDPDYVTGVEVGEQLERVGTEDFATRHQLDPARAVLDVGESRAAVKALDHQPAGKSDRVGPVTVTQQRLRLDARMGRLEPARVGINSVRSESLELFSAIAYDRRKVGLFLFRHDRKD
jgi:hypothetical protein